MLIIVVATAAYWITDLLITFGSAFSTYRSKGLPTIGVMR